MLARLEIGLRQRLDEEVRQRAGAQLRQVALGGGDPRLVRCDLPLDGRRAVLGGRAVPAPAQEHLRRRERARKLAESLARKAQLEGGVALIVSDQVTDGEFFPRYLPDAEVLVIACPHPDDPARRAMKLRLGAVAGTPPLHRLGMASFDRAYGGRWNAGSNKRGGGCTMDPEAYAAEVRRLLTRARSAAS